VSQCHLTRKIVTLLLLAFSALAQPGHSQEGMEAKFQALLRAEGEEYVRLRYEFLANEEAAKAFLFEKKRQVQGKNLSSVLVAILDERLERGEIIEQKIETYAEFQVGDVFDRFLTLQSNVLTARFEEEPMLLVEILWKENKLGIPLFMREERRMFFAGVLWLLGEKRASPVLVEMLGEKHDWRGAEKLGKVLRGLISTEDVQGIIGIVIASEQELACGETEERSRYAADTMAWLIKEIGDNTCVDMLKQAARQAKTEKWQDEFKRLAEFVSKKKPGSNEDVAIAGKQSLSLASARRLPALVHWLSRNGDALADHICADIIEVEYLGKALSITTQKVPTAGISCPCVEVRCAFRSSGREIFVELLSLGPNWHGNRFDSFARRYTSEPLADDWVRKYEGVTAWSVNSAIAVDLDHGRFFVGISEESGTKDTNEEKGIKEGVVATFAKLFLEGVYDAMEGWREELLNTPPEDLEWWDRKMAEEIRKASTETR